MIVFGDPQFSERLSVTLARLRRRAGKVRRDSLDELRGILIECGQVEQAVADSDESPAFYEQEFRTITNLAAHVFCTAYAKKNSEPPRISIHADPSLSLFREKLAQDFPYDILLTLKIPEGYEFYTLYPEQYCISAARWAEEHPEKKQVLVVGLRSIGTSLSAVVATILNEIGVETTRITTRPKGNPFQRTATFPEELWCEIQHALIVDEGPGISGSSMAAVAVALVAKEIPPEEISFFPATQTSPAPPPPAPFVNGGIPHRATSRRWSKSDGTRSPCGNCCWRNPPSFATARKSSNQSPISATDFGARTFF